VGWTSVAGERFSRQMMNNPAARIRMIPARATPSGQSEKTRTPQRIESGSAMYSKGATMAASELR